MKYQFTFFSFFITMIMVAQQGQTSLSIIEPKVGKYLTVRNFFPSCQYLKRGVYLVNKDYVVYQNCNSRKIIYPDISTFHLPKYNENGYFAIDKDGIYFRGEKIKIDTTGFQLVGINNDYENPEILWKTNQAVFKNDKKIFVSDVKTFQAVGCYNGSYFKDKNYVYYFDQPIENSDGSTVKKSCDDFTFDKDNAYFKGKIMTYNGKKIIPVNNILLKTAKVVVSREEKLTVLPNIDAVTLCGLSDSYSVDKNHAYYGTFILPVAKENLKNIKVWEQVNRAYLSDGHKVYSKHNDVANSFDATTFGMLPHSDFCYDKKGVYEREWLEKEEKIVYKKFPFKYTAPVSSENTFITDDSRYIIYENQAYDPWDKKLYNNLSENQIQLAKKNKLMLEKVGKDTDVIVDKSFDYLLYRANDKIYWNGKPTTADAQSFTSIINGVIYKDKENVYLYNRVDGLLKIKGMDAKTIQPFNGFIMDHQYLYSDNRRIIKSKDLEILAVFSGYRKGCGLDETPSSNYYLFKNFEGFWLAEISDDITIRFLGKKLPRNAIWNPHLKDKIL